jgi:hypothetical protein
MYRDIKNLDKICAVSGQDHTFHDAALLGNYRSRSKRRDRAFKPWVAVVPGRCNKPLRARWQMT